MILGRETLLWDGPGWKCRARPVRPIASEEFTFNGRDTPSASKHRSFPISLRENSFLRKNYIGILWTLHHTSVTIGNACLKGAA